MHDDHDMVHGVYGVRTMRDQKGSKKNTAAGIKLQKVIGSAANKIKNNSGESLAETLIAVLISSVALLMLAVMINTASNLIIKSQKLLDEYYVLNNKVERRDSAESTDPAYVVEKGKEVSFNKELDDTAEELKWDTTLTADLYENQKIGSKWVIAYQVP